LFCVSRGQGIGHNNFICYHNYASEVYPITSATVTNRII